ncbi:MAG: tetratricopeptide repeat protein [Candidatus Aminicenantes bacterium]|nr:MAG: tetratricopeptide repeat protein [Candidatus Aminicenantes bacterium]
MKRYPVVLLLFSVVLFSLFSQSESGIKKLETRLTSATGMEKLEILVKLARIYIALEPKKVLVYGQEALDLLQTNPSPKHQVALLNSLSAANSLIGDFQKAKKYARQSQTIAKKINDRTGTADALHNLAQAYFFQGDYTQAKGYCSHALTLYEEIDNQEGLAHSFYIMAYISWRLSDLSQAMDYVLKSNKIYEKLDDPRGIALLEMLAGNIYSDQGRYEKTLEFYFKSKRAFQKLEDKERLCQILNNIGYIYTQLKNHIEALKYYNQSLEISRKINSRQTRCYTLNNMGEVHADKGDYYQALDYFNQSLEIKKDLNDKMGEAHTLVNIGKVHRRQGRYQQALQILNQALTTASDINTRIYIRSANQELSLTFEALKDYPQALYYYKKYKEVNNSIFNETTGKKIAEMQTRYEMEKKEKEIALLKKNKAIKELTLSWQRDLNFFIIIVCVLIFIAFFMICGRYRLKVKMSRALSKEIEGHRQTAQKLQESEEKFRILAESSLLGIYILQDNVIQYANPKFLAIFGYPRGEIIGQSPLKFVFKEDHPVVMKEMNQRIAGISDTVCVEFRGITRTREVIRLVSYGGSIHYQGRPAVLETIIDITSKKKTAEKLLRSQKLEAMGILAGGIAHDFNNLLTVMVGNLEMAKEEMPTNTPAYKLLQNIENTYMRAADLGKKLTYFAKGGWIIPQKITLTSILNSVVKEYPDMQSLVNHVSFPADLKPIYGDERQLKQAVIYLLRHAGETKISEENEEVSSRGVFITAENIAFYEGNEFSLNKGDYVRVFFKNHGKQIPPEKLEKIFEPVFSSGRSINQEGTPLELAICHSIIKKTPRPYFGYLRSQKRDHV